MDEETKNKGFIKIYRDMINWEWFDDINTTHLFLTCLLLANYKDKEWHGIKIERGSFITSYEKLSLASHLSVHQVRTSLDKLIATNNVAKSTTRKYTVISIKSYSKYQDVASNTADKWQSNGKQVAITKEYKEIKNSVVAEATPTQRLSFDKFWNAYPRKGYKEETFNLWVSKNYSDSEVEQILYACSQYAKESKQLYPGKFLENEIWKNYKKPISNNDDEFDRKVREKTEKFKKLHEGEME